MKARRKSREELNNFSLKPAMLRYPVVGIGGAGGSLDALKQFFSHLRPGTGMAFVVAVHLPQEFQSDLVALLQLVTLLQVVPVSRPVVIQQDHIYVIAPHNGVNMMGGYLVPLQLRTAATGQYSIADLLFYALAKTQGEKSLAVLLSGAGKNGAIGIKHIRNAGGAVAVQSPIEASMPEMPLAAISTGHVDLILSARNIARSLGYLNALSTWRWAVCQNTWQYQKIAKSRRRAKASQSRGLIRKVGPFEQQIQQRQVAVSRNSVVSGSALTIRKRQALSVDVCHTQDYSLLPTRPSWVAEVIKAASGRAKASRRRALFGNDSALAFKGSNALRTKVIEQPPNGFSVPRQNSEAWFAGTKNSANKNSLQTPPLVMQETQRALTGTEKSTQYAVADLEMIPVIPASEAIHVRDLIANAHLLTAINRELRTRIDEACFVNSDLTNLIRSTHAVALFVNTRMQIRMMTSQAQALLDLDQENRHVMVQQIESRLEYTALSEDLRHVQSSQKALERDVRALDGRHFLMRLQPCTSRSGRPIGTMMTLSDVTALRVTEQRLRASDRQLRLAVQMPQVAIITIDDLGHITAWNSGAAALFQWQEHEMLGVSLSKIFIDEDGAQFQLPLDLATARSRGLLENQGMLKRKDLSVFHASGTLTPLGTESRHGFAAVVHDVSNQRLVAASLERIVAQEQEIRQKVQSANRLKDEFLAVMSHELKHPLNLIHVSAELLSRHPDAASSPVITNAADAICDAVRSQSKIIDDLLDLSRIRTGKLALKTTLHPIDRTVGAVVAAAHDGAQKAGVRLTLKISESPIMVECDRVRVEQITWNLISNALKFTPAGGSVNVALRCDAPANSVILDVSDTGQGIDADHLHHIFEMFHQGSSNVDRNESGLGIGLALVRELVHAHRGQIRATSLGRDKGSTFTVLLPGLRNADVGSEDLVPTHSVNPLSGLRLLLVDDSRKTIEMFAAVLRLEGCTVDTAYAGAEALSRMVLNDYDLLISDLSMPGMSGFELIALARASNRNNSVLAIALSGFSQPVEIARALAAGFDGHLPKPSGVAKIKTAVLKLRSQRNARFKSG